MGIWVLVAGAREDVGGRELADALESVPFGGLAQYVRADEEAHAPLRVQGTEVLQGTKRQARSRQVALDGADLDALDARECQLAHACSVLERRQLLVKCVVEDRHYHDALEAADLQRVHGGQHVGDVRRVEASAVNCDRVPHSLGQVYSVSVSDASTIRALEDPLSMTRAAVATAQPVGRVPRSVEFLVVGGATLFLYPLLWLLRATVGLDSAELAVGFLMFHGAHLINDPHFSVTYLLFYKDARRRAFGPAFGGGQRVRYLIAGVFVPLALGAWLFGSLSAGSARSLGLAIQLMFLLVGWHYVKQGFGVLSVLSARRGVHYNALERRAFLAHCFAGWAYAWSNPASPAIEAEEKGIIYSSFAHPALLEQLCACSFALSGMVLAALLFRKWRRERRLPPLAPLTGLLVSIWAWSVYSSADPLMLYMIPALHSVQYLYFVWLLGKNQARAAELPPFFGPPARQRLLLLAASALLLGWLLFHAGPELLDSARLGAQRRAHEVVRRLGQERHLADAVAEELVGVAVDPVRLGA